MKLSEILELIKNENGEIRIGSQTGFIYVGLKKSFDKDKKLLDKYYSTSFEDREVREIFPTLMTRGIGILLEGEETSNMASSQDYERWKESAKKRKKKD